MSFNPGIAVLELIERWFSIEISFKSFFLELPHCLTIGENRFYLVHTVLPYRRVYVFWYIPVYSDKVGPSRTGRGPGQISVGYNIKGVATKKSIWISVSLSISYYILSSMPSINKLLKYPLLLSHRDKDQRTLAATFSTKPSPSLYPPKDKYL